MNDPLGLFGEEENTDPLGLFDQEKPKAGFGVAFKKALAGAGNAMESAISLPAGALANYAGFQEQGDEIFRKMEANRATRNKWANPDNLETSLGQDLAGTALSFPAQIPAMLGQAGEKGMDLIQRGEPLKTAIPATVTDTALNALGMGPMAAAKTVLGRAAIGAAGNIALGAGSDAATQALATKEETKKAYDPYDARRRFQDAVVGGVTQGALGERPKAPKTPAKGSRALSALDALSEAKKVADDAAVKAPSEQLNLFDQFDERSPVSPYQTEMAPDMWRVDENGIPIRADLSMEVQNLQQPLQRNLFGDELDANFPRDPNKPLDMATGDIPGVERFSEPVQFRNDPEGQIPLTEAIDQMPEGVRNRVDGKFAEGTTRQSALDRLRGELFPDNGLKTAIQDADMAQWLKENSKVEAATQPLGSKARKMGWKRRQGGGVLQDPFGRVPESSDKLQDQLQTVRYRFQALEGLPNKDKVTHEQIKQVINRDGVSGPEKQIIKNAYAIALFTSDRDFVTAREFVDGLNDAIQDLTLGKTKSQEYADFGLDRLGRDSGTRWEPIPRNEWTPAQLQENLDYNVFPERKVKTIEGVDAVTNVWENEASLSRNAQNHFDSPDYVGHTRNFKEEGVRHVVEIQSDLLQKLRASEEPSNNDKTRKQLQSNWPIRLIREELADAARNGEKTVRFATADTMAKVEGWANHREQARRDLPQLEHIVQRLRESATDPDALRLYEQDLQQSRDRLTGPQFGPQVQGIYDRYQKDVAKYLKSIGGSEVTDAQGHTWLEVPVDKTRQRPIMFGQRGALLVDWKKKPELEQLTKIAGIKEKLGNLIPTKATPQEVVEASRAMPDVDQNVVQRGINNFTKGGLYQAEKTNNPVIKFTVDKVLEADRLARADVRDLIHDRLAPTMRALSTSEMTEIATVLNHADKIETPVTSEFLRAQGFSEKQIAFAEAHKTAMDASFESINTAREKAGLKPVSKRAAYSAMNFTGDFRKLVYKVGEDGEKTVVGVLGAKTAFGLKSLEKQLKATNPEYEIEPGKPRYMAGGGNDRGGSAVQAVQRALELLSENNGEVKQFLDVLDEIKTNEAYDFLGAKAHTKQKKGVFGSEGRKPWLSAEQNAKDFMDAQLQYAEAALRWGHLSNASNDIKQLLASDLNMPNAKEWSESYLQNALGVNPSKTGRTFENAVNSIWEASGIGKTIPTNIQQYSRKAVNTVLLGLNPAFLSTNVVQPLLSMPAMASFLQSRGVDTFVTGYDNMAKAGFTLFKEMTDTLSPLEKEAQKYAKEKHVFGSDLVDTSSLSRKNAEFYLDKTGNFLASNVESSTRRMVYYTFVHMLDANGMGKEFGLAHNLTDMAMNNYSPVERPKVFNALGPIGDMAANLSSYKHNELSRLALFAREIGKEGNAAPFLTQIATSVAAAGITGALGFQEADWLYKQITKAMGAPDSLTRVVIDFSEGLSDDVKNKYVASHGVFAALGVDMSKRLGISDVIPNSLGEAAFPGGSKLVDIGAAGLSAIGDPSEMNLKRLAREASPGVVTGPMDRAWFSADTPQGELGLNRKTLEGQVIRTEADKMAKNLGFTGINESVMKQKLYDLEQQGIGYTELRTAVVKKMVDQMHSEGKVSPELIQNYMRYEGDPQQLETDLIAKVKKGKMSAIDAVKVKALAAKTIPQLYQGQRTLETFGESQ